MLPASDRVGEIPTEGDYHLHSQLIRFISPIFAKPAQNTRTIEQQWVRRAKLTRIIVKPLLLP